MCAIVNWTGNEEVGGSDSRRCRHLLRTFFFVYSPRQTSYSNESTNCRWEDTTAKEWTAHLM